MTTPARMDAILDWLHQPDEIVDCLTYVELMHRSGQMPDDEASQWVLKILARAEFLDLASDTSPAD